jgi:H2-forming N5,N10-methylenetetrahydromethanopterin dehydrogenase-like enzyme
MIGIGVYLARYGMRVSSSKPVDVPKRPERVVVAICARAQEGVHLAEGEIVERTAQSHH